MPDFPRLLHTALDTTDPRGLAEFVDDDGRRQLAFQGVDGGQLVVRPDRGHRDDGDVRGVRGTGVVERRRQPGVVQRLPAGPYGGLPRRVGQQLDRVQLRYQSSHALARRVWAALVAGASRSYMDAIICDLGLAAKTS